MLAAKTENGPGWSQKGRVTTGTALALKGRLMLLWCSPLFNRTNDENRWKTAYETMKLIWNVSTSVVITCILPMTM